MGTRLLTNVFDFKGQTTKLWKEEKIYKTNEIKKMLISEEKLNIKYKGKWSLTLQEQKKEILYLNDYLMNSILRKKGQEIANRELDNGYEYILKLTREMMNSIEIYKENIKVIKEFYKIKGE